MKKIYKKLLLCLLLTLITIIPLHTLKVVDANTQIASNNYYYNQLSDSSKKYYNAISKMTESLKEGKDFDLVTNNILNQSYIKKSLNDNSILKDFGAGKDAYYLDNQDMFYVDFDKLSINLSMQGNKYIVTIGNGRYDTYMYEGFENKETVLNSITQYNNKIEQYKSELDKIESDIEKIKLANKLICDNVTYSFEADGTTEKKSQIRTSYGALVNGYAVCEGYARAFKTLMNTQNILCVEVIGYYQNDNGGQEPHAWNYVNLKGKWYLVDTTFNDSSENITQYLLIGKEKAKQYSESQIISTSGYEFTYPKLVNSNYGEEELLTEVEYKTDKTPSQIIKINFGEYKTLNDVLSNNMYVVGRHELYIDGEYLGWGQWYTMQYYIDRETNTLSINQHTYSTQLAVISYDLGSNFYETLEKESIIAISDILTNDIFDEKAYMPLPIETNPSSSTVLSPDEVYNMTIRYDSKIKIKDENKKIGVTIYNEYSSNLGKYVKIEDVKIVDDYTISFTFTPSKMYEHDMLTYKFIPLNIVGSTSGLQPRYAGLTFARPYRVCSKIYNNGRLYIDAYGSPTIIDSQDLSMTGFLDENGNQIASNQRSQLVLVAEKPNQNETKIMTDNIKELLNNKEIKSSATYELNLHICGGIKQIPSGSYVKVAFGFPEGYGPEDKGVTFKVYHFKKDSNGVIDPTKTEEVKCVVTEYGIVVTVDSFSPFMILATEKEEVTTKNIYTKTVNNCGEVIATLNKDTTSTQVKGIVSLNKDESVTYKIIENTNYKVDYVILNNKVVNIENNTITLNYDNLSENNELIIGFVSKSTAQKEQEQNIKSLDVDILTNNVSNYNNTQTKGLNNKLIFILTGVITFVLTATISILVIKKKNKENH